MIRGAVDESGLPVIELEIAGRTWRAAIDTGFNGDLELPYALGAAVKARYFGRGSSFLAGAQVLEEDHYLVELLFDGRVVRALASFVPGDGILIGTNLLRDYRLVVDFPNAEVQLTSE